MTTLFPDIPRLYTGVAEGIAVLLYMRWLKPRWKDWRQLGAMIATLVIQISLQLFAGILPLILWIPGMLLNIAWMVLSLLFLTQKDLRVSLFFGTKAFIVAELIASVAWQCYCYWLLGTAWDNTFSRFALMSLLYAFFLGIIYLVERSTNKSSLTALIHSKEVLLALLTGIIIFSMGNVGFILTDSRIATTYDSNTIFIIRSFINVSGFLILFTQEQHLLETHLRSELTAIQNVFQNQYEQYRAFNENSELIRKKVHDLKHQIDYLKQETNSDKRTAYFKEIDTMIQNFEAKIETGNAVLDTVLTRKNQYCLEHSISFSCLVQGELLNQMDTIDLTTLFGNAIDNAIEATETITDPDKRLITLKVTSKAAFTIIRLDNYFEETLTLTDDTFPQTSKADKDSHGYGLKSMQYIVDQYNGTMTLTQEDNWVKLAILLPQTKDNEKNELTH